MWTMAMMFLFLMAGHDASTKSEETTSVSMGTHGAKRFAPSDRTNPERLHHITDRLMDALKRTMLDLFERSGSVGSTSGRANDMIRQAPFLANADAPTMMLVLRHSSGSNDQYVVDCCNSEIRLRSRQKGNSFLFFQSRNPGW